MKRIWYNAKILTHYHYVCGPIPSPIIAQLDIILYFLADFLSKCHCDQTVVKTGNKFQNYGGEKGEGFPCNVKSCLMS